MSADLSRVSSEAGAPMCSTQWCLPLRRQQAGTPVCGLLANSGVTSGKVSRRSNQVAVMRRTGVTKCSPSLAQDTARTSWADVQESQNPIVAFAASAKIIFKVVIELKRLSSL